MVTQFLFFFMACNRLFSRKTVKWMACCHSKEEFLSLYVPSLVPLKLQVLLSSSMAPDHTDLHIPLPSLWHSSDNSVNQFSSLT